MTAIGKWSSVRQFSINQSYPAIPDPARPGPTVTLFDGIFDRKYKKYRNFNTIFIQVLKLGY